MSAKEGSLLSFCNTVPKGLVGKCRRVEIKHVVKRRFQLEAGEEELCHTAARDGWYAVRQGLLAFVEV
jgi:hypothetical protein